jgi:hypothetical protein
MGICLISFLGGAIQAKSETQTTAELETNVGVKIDHQDALPFFVKIKKDMAAPPKDSGQESSTTSTESEKQTSLVCYGNGLCLVRDDRKINISPGLNEIILEGILSDVIDGSFEVLVSKKISLLCYKVLEKSISRENLFSAAIGEAVFFQTVGNHQQEKGKLLCIFRDKDSVFAIIEKDSRCFIVPIDRCISIGQSALKCLGKNSLFLFFEASDWGNAYIKITYLTSSVQWKHISKIDISENLEKINITADALLKNNSNVNLKNARVVLNSSAPPTASKDFEDKKLKGKADVHVQDLNSLDLEKGSTVSCPLQPPKEYKPFLEYVVKISSDMLNGNVVRDVPVQKILILEKVATLGLGVDMPGSELLIFHRKSEEKNFLGRWPLENLIKDNTLMIEMGMTQDMFAQMQQTDSRKISEKQTECGIRVNIHNNRSSESYVWIMVNLDNQSWKIMKSNFEPQSNKRSWRIKLNPNESKELHARIWKEN